MSGKTSEDISSYSYLKRKSILTTNLIIEDMFHDIGKMKKGDK